MNRAANNEPNLPSRSGPNDNPDSIPASAMLEGTPVADQVDQWLAEHDMLEDLPVDEPVVRSLGGRIEHVGLNKGSRSVHRLSRDTATNPQQFQLRIGSCGFVEQRFEPAFKIARHRGTECSHGAK